MGILRSSNASLSGFKPVMIQRRSVIEVPETRPSPLQGWENFVRVEACPLCDSPNGSATGDRVSGVHCWIGREHFFQPAYEVKECADCGLLYKDVRLKEEGLRDYYARTDYRKWEISGLYPTERAALKYLKSFPARSRFLDFGCSSGRLLSFLVHQYECFGCEWNVEAAEAARAKGVRVLPSDFKNSEYHETFDAIVLSDVFEHLSQPNLLLKQLFQCLKPGGSFILTTGNGDAGECRKDPAQHWYFRNVEHLCMMTQRAAMQVEKALGGEIISWTELSHYDEPWLSQMKQRVQSYAYWQFSRNTVFSKFVLRWIPYVRRARKWSIAPAITCAKDHVFLVVRKLNRHVG